MSHFNQTRVTFVVSLFLSDKSEFCRKKWRVPILYANEHGHEYALDMSCFPYANQISILPKNDFGCSTELWRCITVNLSHECSFSKRLLCIIFVSYYTDRVWRNLNSVDRIPQTPVNDSWCLPLGALQSMWATWLTCAPRRSIVLHFFWHVDILPISPFLFFFNSTFYLCIIIVIFLPDVFDTLTEVAGNRTSHYLCECFSDTDISSSFHCTAPECLELIWVGVSQEVYLNFHHFCG